uniref:(northern house mosquito) hypothetical protein n=1 Tax=Culex pipiens TaxID=7175 RepID=A0A8D8AVW2_CULPI
MPIWTSSMVGNARARKFPGLVQVQLLSFAGQQPVRGHGGTLSGRKTEGTLFSVRLVDCDTTTKIECIEKDDEEICADLPVDVALEEKIPHPEYDELSKLNKIALLRMARDDSKQTLSCLSVFAAGIRISVAGDVNFGTAFGRTLEESRSLIKQKLGIKV